MIITDHDPRSSFCDVTLHAGDGGPPLVGHKVILASVSSYLAEVLRRSRAIRVRNIEHDTLSTILYYIYHGHVAVPKTSVGAILQAARTLGIASLVESIMTSGGSDHPMRVMRPYDHQRLLVSPRSQPPPRRRGTQAMKIACWRRSMSNATRTSPQVPSNLVSAGILISSTLPRSYRTTPRSERRAPFDPRSSARTSYKMLASRASTYATRPHRRCGLRVQSDLETLRRLQSPSQPRSLPMCQARCTFSVGFTTR